MKIIKKIYLPIFAALITFGATAQMKVGDNPNTISTSSLLELESPTKALKLTGVKDTTMITTPLNGMMVYDSSRGCVTVYQNNSWSPCAGGGGSTTGNGVNNAQWATNLTFKSIISCQSSRGVTGGITTAGNVYFWGISNGDNIAMLSGNTKTMTGTRTGTMFSPVWQNSPLFNGIAQKLQIVNQGGGDTYGVLTSTGKLYFWGENNTYLMGLGASGSTGGNGGGSMYTQATATILPSGTKFIDFAMQWSTRMNIAITDDGKAWFCGYNSGPGSYVGATDPVSGATWQPTWKQIAAPSAGVTYTKVWTNYRYLTVIYLLGSDGNLYATGINRNNIFGNPAAASNGTGVDPTLAAGIYKVLLPVGTVVTKIISGNENVTGGYGNRTMALTSTGAIYAWGHHYQTTQPSQIGFATAATGAVTDATNTTMYVFKTPVLVTPPAGETGFTDMALSSNANTFAGMTFYICKSGKAYHYGQQTLSPVSTGEDGMINNALTVPWNGYRQVEALNGITADNVVYHSGTSFWWNSNTGTIYTFGYNDYSQSTGYPRYIFPARPMLSGFNDYYKSTLPSTNSTTTGSNPYPGPGY